jgi:fermentation-respiration switch protein FrsA (DUF1100 family)
MHLGRKTCEHHVYAVFSISDFGQKVHFHNLSSHISTLEKRATWETPLLVIHGSADLITSPAEARKFLDEVSSPVKVFKSYEGFLHVLLWDPEKALVFKDIVEWLGERL